jgi:hypothetical protein
MKYDFYKATFLTRIPRVSESNIGATDRRPAPLNRGLVGGQNLGGVYVEGIKLLT